MGRKELSRNTLKRGNIVEYYASGNGHWSPITVTLNTGISKITVSYTKINGTSTGVSASKEFTSSGTITDAFIGKTVSYTVTVATGYNPVADGSITAAEGAAISPTTSLQQFTITWKYLSAYPDTYTTATQTYNYGATPSRTAPSTVTSGNDRKVFSAWDNLAVVTAARTITAQYTTQHYLTFNSTRSTCNKSTGWYDHSTTAFTATWTASANCSFGGSTAQDTTTQSVTPNQAGTYSKSADYIYVTIQAGSNNSSVSPTAGSKFVTYNSTCTWTSATNYSYDAGSTKTNKTVNLTTPGGTYTNSPTNVKVSSITANYCTASINTTNYYANTTKITWTAGSNYSFGGSSVGDTTTDSTAIVAGGSYSKSPSYVKCTISGTRCSANKTSGSILAVGTEITWTASSGYSFAAGTSATSTSTAIVALGTTSYSKSADYKSITVSGTNCSANVANGYRLIGSTITWTGNSGTNYKYGFSSATNWSDSYATTTATIVADTSSYSKTASYLYYNVTISPATNCTANVSSGYRLNGTQVTFTTTAATSTIRYSFSNSDSTVYSVADTNTMKVKSAGQTISSGTVYIWYNVSSITGTRCSSTNSTGWYVSGSTITWTADTNYSFASGSSRTATATSTVTAAGTYTKSADYGLYTVGNVPTRATKDTNTGYYALTAKTTTYTANSNCAWNSTGTETTKTVSGTPPCTITAPAAPGYIYVTIGAGSNNSGVNPTAGSKWVAYNSSCTWTSATNYSYDSGTTKTNKTVNLTTPGGSYTYSPSYIYVTVTKTNCTGNGTGYWTSPQTYTAESNRAFDSSGTTTKSYTFTAGGSISPATTHLKATLVTGTRCTQSSISTNTWYANGTTITWNANDNYSFASGTTRDASDTVTMVPGANTYSANYGLYTVGAAPSHTTKNVSTGYFALSAKTTRYTADTGWYWDTSGTNYKDVSGTPPCTITAPAAPSYCSITTSGTNCTPNPNYSTATIVANGTTVSFTAATNYSASAGATQTNPSSQTVSGPGSYTASCTNGKYTKGTLTNCTTTWTSGNYYALNSSIPYSSSDSSKYAVNSSGTTTASDTFSAPGTYNKSFDYKRLLITYTNCTKASGGTDNGWYNATSKTVAATGNTGWYFTSSSQAYSQSHTLPSITTVQPTYALIKKGTCSNCSSVKVGSTDVTTSGIVARLTSYDSTSKVTYTASTGYVWNTSGATTTTTNITGPETVNQTPGYMSYTIKGVARTNHTSDSTAYAAINSTISYTWTTSQTYYAFDNSGTRTASNSKTLNATGLSLSVSAPGYYYYGTWPAAANTNHTTASTVGWQTSNTYTVTYTANTGYAYNSSGAATATSTANPGGNFTAQVPSYGYVTISALNCSATSGGSAISTGWKLLSSSPISLTFTANTDWSFGGSTTSDTTIGSVNVPGSISKTPSYCEVTINATNSTAKIGTTDVSNTTAIRQAGTTIIWTPTTYYSFDAGSTQTTKSTTISGPTTYSGSPGYIKAASITPNYCTANRNASTYYAIGTTITWSAQNDYSFNGTNTTDTTTTTLTAGGVFSKTPGYTMLRKCSVTRCSGDLTTNTLYKNGNDGKTPAAIITWTADPNYSFTEGTTRTATTTTTIGLDSEYIMSADFGLYTVGNAPSHTTKNVNTGYYALSSKTTRYTADSGWYWDTSGTSYKDVSGTPPCTITAPTAPTYVKVITSNGTNSTVDTARLNVIVLNTTTATWTSTNANYGFTNAGAQTKTVTLNAPGSYSYSPEYKKLQVTYTNCTANSTANGWYTDASKTIQAKANTGWSFNSTGTTTGDTNTAETVTLPSVNKSYTASYVLIKLGTATNCSGKVGSTTLTTTGLKAAVPATITWTATDTSYSFNERATSSKDSSAATTTDTVNSYSAGGWSKSAPYVYCTMTPQANSTVSPTSGYRTNGATVTFTANAQSGNTDWSFSNTSRTDDTRNSYTVSRNGSISGPTVYTWYYATISPTTNYSADLSTGWYLNGTQITFTAPDNSTTKRYSFSTTTSETHTQKKTINSGTTYQNDTASVWYYITISPVSHVNISGSSATDWYLNGATVTLKSTQIPDSMTVVVSYNANGGSSTPQSQTTSPTRPYTVTGWQKGSTSISNDANTTATVDSSVTYSPKTPTAGSWSYPSITTAAAIARNSTAVAGGGGRVQYAAGAGTGTLPGDSVADATRNYTFSTWNNGTNNVAASTSYTPTASVTLTAVWSWTDVSGSVTLATNNLSFANTNRNIYTVIYHGNSPSSTSHPCTVTGLPPDGTASDTWSRSANGWDIGASGATYTPTAGTVTATAQCAWNARTANATITVGSLPGNSAGTHEHGGSYTITYNVNGGSNLSKPSDKPNWNYKWEASKWNTNGSGTGTDYSPGATITNSNAILYAIWSDNFKSVNAVTLPTCLAPDGGETAGFVVTFNTHGGSAISPVTALDPYWYTNGGWGTSSTGGKVGEQGASYTPDQSRTLYALWTLNTTRGYINEPSEPTRTGYTFDGWYTAESGGTLYTFPYQVTAPVEMHAHWTPNSYNLKFVRNSSTYVTGGTYQLNNGSAQTIPWNTNITVHYGDVIKNVNITYGSPGSWSFTSLSAPGVSYYGDNDNSDLEIANINSRSVTLNYGDDDASTPGWKTMSCSSQSQSILLQSNMTLGHMYMFYFSAYKSRACYREDMVTPASAKTSTGYTITGSIDIEVLGESYEEEALVESDTTWFKPETILTKVIRYYYGEGTYVLVEDINIRNGYNGYFRNLTGFRPTYSDSNGTWTLANISGSPAIYGYPSGTWTGGQNNVNQVAITSSNLTAIEAYGTYTPSGACTVSWTAGTGVTMWSSTSSTAYTSGNPSGYTYTAGQTVYVYAKVTTANYFISSAGSISWTVVSGTLGAANTVYRCVKSSIASSWNLGTINKTANPTLIGPTSTTSASTSITVQNNCTFTATKLYYKLTTAGTYTSVTVSLAQNATRQVTGLSSGRAYNFYVTGTYGGYTWTSSTTTFATTYNLEKYTINGGRVYWSKTSITTSGGTETLSSITYGSTIYWRIAAWTGYNTPSTYYGSMTFNSNNFSWSGSYGLSTYIGSAIGNCTIIGDGLTPSTAFIIDPHGGVCTWQNLTSSDNKYGIFAKITPTTSGYYAFTVQCLAGTRTDTGGSVWQGTGSTIMSHNDDGAGNYQPEIVVSLTANTTYYFQLTYYNNRQTWNPSSGTKLQGQYSLMVAPAQMLNDGEGSPMFSTNDFSGVLESYYSTTNDVFGFSTPAFAASVEEQSEGYLPCMAFLVNKTNTDCTTVVQEGGRYDGSQCDPYAILYELPQLSTSTVQNYKIYMITENPYDYNYQIDSMPLSYIQNGIINNTISHAFQYKTPESSGSTTWFVWKVKATNDGCR